MKLVPITVEEEFRKNPHLKKEDLDKLTGWLKTQPHLPQIPDLDLILFLHSCDYDLEFTKQSIDKYYTIRTHTPEFFSNRSPAHPSVASAMEVASYFIMPGLTDAGGIVMVFKLYDTNPARFDINNLMKYFINMKDLMLQELGTCKGVVIVFDTEGLQWGHMLRMNVFAIKKAITYLQEAMPAKLLNVHFINPFSLQDKLMALARPFLKKEVIDSIHVHAHGMDSFYAHVPRRMIPADMGGEAPCIAELRGLIREKVKANADFFIEEEKLRVVESLRPVKSKDVRRVFGVKGFFN